MVPVELIAEVSALRPGRELVGGELVFHVLLRDGEAVPVLVVQRSLLEGNPDVDVHRAELAKCRRGERIGGRKLTRTPEQVSKA